MNRADDTADRLARLCGAVDAGAKVSKTDVAFLRECLRHPRKSLQRAAAECFAALSRRDPQGEAQLFDELESLDPRTRWAAAYAVSRLGKFPPVAVDTAIELLGTEDRDLRWAAAELLERAVLEGGSQVMERLCAVAGNGSFLQRRMALYALRNLGIHVPEALGAAHDAVDEVDVELRLAGLAALVRLSTDASDAADRVVFLLDDSEPRVRRAAAAALGALGCRSTNVLRALEHALASDDEAVRRAARKSSERLGRE
jgi:HEAT repeat protein